MSHEVALPREQVAAKKNVHQLTEVLHDALDLMKQLEAGTVVGSNWIATRDRMVAEAKILLLSPLQWSRGLHQFLLSEEAHSATTNGTATRFFSLR
ncbi:MAG: hypothetical protein E6J34_12170 [Chloroflexi bacterium]|nr:MAG: hypothetical protein E6J34_12170 [Chloroflexota bacterium]